MEQALQRLSVPTGVVDAVLDTDCFNEIDDQFALAFLLRSPERVRLRAVLAAPFLNKKVESPKEGMEKSFLEIQKVLSLACPDGQQPEVWRGSERFLPDEKTPVDSEAARKLAALAMEYTSAQPLYVVAIAAATNVASAILLRPEICDRIVVVWLGGEAYHYRGNFEFNLRQDVAAGRVLFGSGAATVQLPCRGVVSQFTTSRYELEHWLLGKNPLADYLASNCIAHCEALSPGKPWSKPLWDVTAAAWLLNDDERFMLWRTEHAPIAQYDHTYAFDASRPMIGYVFFIKRDALFEALVEKLTNPFEPRTPK